MAARGDRPGGRRADVLLVAGLTVLSTLAFAFNVPVGASLAADVSARYVPGSVDVNNPGGEAFWSDIAGTAIPLTTTNDYGGGVKTVTLKTATNGESLFIYAEWSDPTESRIKNNVIENDSFPALFYANSTFAYEDRIVFWWSMDATVGPPPCMQKSAPGHGEGESLAGTGNLWHWKAARTDSLGASWGQLTYGSGPNINQTMAYRHSYADNEFINTTGHFQLGYDQYPDSFTLGYGEQFIPYDTYLVSAHGVYTAATHTWRWAASRSLATSPSLHTVQFHPGQLYSFSVGIWDGGPIPIPATWSYPTGWTAYGENEETKSISAWHTLEISSTPPTLAVPTVTQPTDGAQVSGTVQVQGTSSAGTTGVQVAVGSGAWTNATGNTSWSYAWDTSAVQDGAYSIRVRASNGLSFSPEKSVSVLVANTHSPPAAPAITQPASGAKLTGTVELKGTAPAGTTSVQVRIGNGPWINATGTTSWSYSWASSSVPDGAYSVEARTFDGTGYSTDQVVSVQVANAPAASTGVDLAVVAGLGLVLLVAGLVVGAKVLGKRPAKGTDGKGAEGKAEAPKADKDEWGEKK